MNGEKAIWEMKEFWMPVIVGIAGSIAFLLQQTLGIEVDPAIIVSAIVALAGILFGVGWTVVKKLQVITKDINHLTYEMHSLKKK